jgi:hypothetical protein
LIFSFNLSAIFGKKSFRNCTFRCNVPFTCHFVAL